MIRTPWRRIAALLLPVALLATLLTVVSEVASSGSRSASAATTSGFQAGNIVSDQTFFNSGSMSAAQIQSFLASKVVTCQSGRTCLKDFSQTTSSKAADAYCSGYTGRAGESAATILARVGQACGINPQVLLVTLQKEQGLVQSTGPSASAYTIAMGYACPDTAACDTQYYGFFNQLYAAARQFQVYAKNPTYFRYRAGFTNVIQYNPSASCGSASVYIANQATASLYNYTPYTPNAASLAAGYGSAPCGAYGNRNFYLYFMDYFGNPSDWLQSASFEGGTSVGWETTGGMTTATVKNTSSAKDGDYYLSATAPTSGGTILQTAARTSTASEQATGVVWLRAWSGTVTGRIILWGLGVKNESVAQAYTVGTTWTAVTVALPFTTAHTSTRLQVSSLSPGVRLDVDDASLTFGAQPPKQNLLTNGSFEQGIAPWDGGNGQMNKVASTDPRFVLDGSRFGAVNTTVAGRSVAQSIAIPATANQQYTFTIYVRTSDSKKPYVGRLALWALDGTTPVNRTTSFSAVNSGWTKVSTTVDTGTTKATRLKAEVYLGTLTTSLWLDKASVSPNLLDQGSFETGTTPWSRSSSVVNWARYTGTGQPDGSWFLQANSSTAGTSLAQDAPLKPLRGSTYTASVWVRGSSTAPVKGRLALWSFGATASAASVPFTTTSSWTRVEVQIPIGTADVTGLRVEVYLDTVGSTVSIDSAQLY